MSSTVAQDYSLILDSSLLFCNHANETHEGEGRQEGTNEGHGGNEGDESHEGHEGNEGGTNEGHEGNEGRKSRPKSSIREEMEEQLRHAQHWMGDGGDMGLPSASEMNHLAHEGNEGRQEGTNEGHEDISLKDEQSFSRPAFIYTCTLMTYGEFRPIHACVIVRM
jgi:hypothetical protein